MGTIAKRAPVYDKRKEESSTFMKVKLPERYNHLPYKKGRYLQLNSLYSLIDLVNSKGTKAALKISFDDEKQFITDFARSSTEEQKRLTRTLKKEIDHLAI